MQALQPFCYGNLLLYQNLTALEKRKLGVLSPANTKFIWFYYFLKPELKINDEWMKGWVAYFFTNSLRDAKSQRGDKNREPMVSCFILLRWPKKTEEGNFYVYKIFGPQYLPSLLQMQGVTNESSLNCWMSLRLNNFCLPIKLSEW